MVKLCASGYPEFLGKDPADETVEWSESTVQAYIVMQSRRAGYKCAGGMEQGARGGSAGARAKAAGLTAGEPDVRFYMSGGRVVFVELKLAKGGRLSDVQVVYHEMLRGLGHMVFVVYAKSPVDGWEQVRDILEGVA